MLVLSGSVKWSVTARNAAAIGEREFRAVRERLSALHDDTLLATPFDARKSALAALLAVRVADKVEVQAFLRQLHRGADFTLARVEELEMLARAVLYIVAQAKHAASMHERAAWDDMLRRAWTLLVPVYGEVRMAEALAGSPDQRAPASRRSLSGTERPTERPMARRHPRVDVELDIVVVSEPNFLPGYVENISEGGLFVATRAPMPVGSRVTMIIGLPDGGDPIAVEGEVRWQRTTEGDVSPGMGIRFVGVPSESEGRIRAFIASRAPSFFEE